MHTTQIHKSSSQVFTLLQTDTIQEINFRGREMQFVYRQISAGEMCVKILARPLADMLILRPIKPAHGPMRHSHIKQSTGSLVTI